MSTLSRPNYAVHILANENIPREAVALLRARGHDVLWVRDMYPGISDPEVLSIADREHRLLITFDRDYGELIFRRRMSAPAGLIYFRVEMTAPKVLSQIVADVVDSRNDWIGAFSVVDEKRIRIQAMPMLDP